ncbi:MULTISPECIES: Lrp/AsnC family transcriptional regulator [unclassified Rathayibacter]|uniref:Lrp/AsnC family transcriptional regulator n=1 Tax=unclassified Rathayibacter TaxID=2609250 RepID=UPI001052B59A|nr:MULTISPECIES: Lrp/AsnC family transcriptional regulator [unclassified Rathayibacter]TCL83666.1 AsnC family transcriptional regulator [Rathayibacter sp. PhB192]TCM29259.1 AsnC family transcriptional regulator [Rathayibacter sp. PhB179]
MDAVDRKILAELQANGRISLTDLAARVTLSVSPCHRRVRALEQAGVITGYRARLDHAALGLGFQALIFVTMRSSDRDTLHAFESAVSEQPNILDAQRLFGKPDYLLRVAARDLPAFQQFYDDQLAALPGVQLLTSTLVMKNVIEDRTLPL